MQRLSRLTYLCSRWLISRLARPQLTGAEVLEGLPDAERNIYVMENRSLSDLIVLDIACQQHGLPSPLTPIDLAGEREQRRFFFLNRAAGGLFRRNTMQTYSRRMTSILGNIDHATEARLLPVAVFWGRSPAREGTVRGDFLSENWAVTSRLKRLINLFLSRHHIVVNFGSPVALSDLQRIDTNRLVRHVARLLRVRLRNQRAATLGPDISHQRTLVNQILASKAVQQAINAEEGNQLGLERRARKAALSIVSNMSMPTVRILEKLLRWFWHKIYRGLSIHGMQQVLRVAETHTVVYVPSHRSHVDYLLLSYVLFQHGLMIPHIAAGDNLNLPVVGAILRRGGAFFMRRQFRDDPIYAAVFAEYLYQVYRRGHAVEFFPEGGRSRTGRLLPARVGLLKMTVEHEQRGVPRPLALVPVYFGYEKLIEATSYLNELRGGKKRRESISDVFRSLKLIREDFGQVQINFGEPLLLREWLQANADSDQPAALGREILLRINEAAAVTPINLVALATLSTPRNAIDESLLVELIEGYLQLLHFDQPHQGYTVTSSSAQEAIEYAERLGMLTREHYEFGDVLCHDNFSAVLMTWYRNNVSHILALPSLIAALVRQRRRPLSRLALERMVGTVVPYIAEELHMRQSPTAFDRWLQHLLAAGLLQIHATGGYCAPPISSTKHNQLWLLANIIMPTLERLYIVIALLAQPGETPLTRESLQSQSSNVAHKMSRIFGLNAPEFFDARLYNNFVDKLISDGGVMMDEASCLHHTPAIIDVFKAAQTVIDPELRYALFRES